MQHRITKAYRSDCLEVLELDRRDVECRTMMTKQTNQFSKHNPGPQSFIYVTSRDKQRLDNLLMEVEASNLRKHGDLKALEEELSRAIIVDPKDVPADVITMNSRAEMLDLDSSETVTFTLVFPSEANVEEGRISVLAPIGAGMLGYRLHDEFEWTVPGGVRGMRVTKLHYQPEASGNFDR